MQMYFLLNGGDFPANLVSSQRYTISKKNAKDIRSHQKEKKTKSAHVFLTTHVEANKKLLVLECWMVRRDGDQTHANDIQGNFATF